MAVPDNFRTIKWVNHVGCKPSGINIRIIISDVTFKCVIYFFPELNILGMIRVTFPQLSFSVMSSILYSFVIGCHDVFVLFIDSEKVVNKI